ncbi:VTT domain-containing protein [Bacillus sp. LL01]|uniref:TVP38/TMEM64 family protein n=1 Tax=Bacillus sp. LL01 TaxID=1665556 RepID=UPI00069FEC70|nr:VTT domain-containing protein [Bacillus sp. LL01]
MLSFSAVAVSLIWVVQTEWFSIFKSGDIEQIQLFLREEIFSILLITFLLMSIQNLFTLIPIVGIIVINIALFGFVYGYLWSLATSVVGAMMAFIVFRYWFQSLLIHKVKKGYIEKLEKNGFLFVLLLRVVPFIPSSFINLAGGVSSIRLTPFLTATFLGNALYLLLLSFIANGLLSEKIEGYLLIALLFAFIPSFFLYRYMKRKVAMLENQKRKVRGD